MMLLLLSLQRYKHLFDVNEKHGSFYLVSKVYRAKECLEQVGCLRLYKSMHPLCLFLDVVC
jgi:hypothetical protein